MAGAPLVRLGLIGAGRWGRNFIRTIRAMDGVALAWVASANPDTPALAGESCPVDPDWRRLLAGGDADAVVIATPPALHAEMTLAAVAHGLPVLVEKPLTLDLAEAEGLLAEVDRRRGYVLVDHVHLFNPAYRALKAAVAGLGTIKAITATAGAHGPFRTDTPVLWDWACHDIALCADLLGVMPETVGIRPVRRQGPGAVYHIVLGFSLGGGAEKVEATLVCGNLFDERVRRFAVETAGGTLTFDDFGAQPLVLREAGGTERPLPVASVKPLDNAILTFAQAVRQGERSAAPLRFAVGVVEALDRLDRALAETSA